MPIANGFILDIYSFLGSGRCPSVNGFMFNRKLDLCFNLNEPVTINYPVIKQFCADMNAELVRIDSAEKQQFIEFITGIKKKL